MLTRSLGFRIARNEGLQTELRKGKIHVIVRTFDECRGTKIRFHEDRGRGSQRLMVERSRRLLRFKQRLEAALEKRGRIREMLKLQGQKVVLESVDSRQCCPWSKDCPFFLRKASTS